MRKVDAPSQASIEGGGDSRAPLADWEEASVTQPIAPSIRTKALYVARVERWVFLKIAQLVATRVARRPREARMIQNGAKSKKERGQATPRSRNGPTWYQIMQGRNQAAPQSQNGSNMVPDQTRKWPGSPARPTVVLHKQA